MRRMSEGRRLFLVIVVGLVVVLGGLKGFRAWHETRGPLAGTWRAVSVQKQGEKSVDVRPLHATLTVHDGTARFTDDINTYAATFHEPKRGEVEVSTVSASAQGRGAASSEQRAVDLLTQKVFAVGTFGYRTENDAATITRDGVTIHLARA